MDVVRQLNVGFLQTERSNERVDFCWLNLVRIIESLFDLVLIRVAPHDEDKSVVVLDANVSFFRIKRITEDVICRSSILVERISGILFLVTITLRLGVSELTRAKTDLEGNIAFTAKQRLGLTSSIFESSANVFTVFVQCVVGTLVQERRGPCISTKVRGFVINVVRLLVL